MENELQEKFLRMFSDYTNFMMKQQARCADYHNQNIKAWNKIEKQLTKRIGTSRSKSYDTYKFLSVNAIPVGADTVNNLKNHMTPIERKTLNLK